MIKTVSLTAGIELAVELVDGCHCCIENRGSGVIYASKSADIVPDSDGVTAIDKGNSKILRNIAQYKKSEDNSYDYYGKIYLLSDSDGKAEIQTANDFSSFKSRKKGGEKGTVVKIDNVQSEKESLNLTTLNNKINSIVDGCDFKITKPRYSVSTPYDFYDGDAVVYNNEIHILGGGYNSGYTKHYKWNGSSWTSVSTLPYSFYRGDAVVYNNEIHILGSNYSSDIHTKHYKWNGSSWTSVSTLPYSFYNGAAVVYNNEIHILGGYNSGYTKHYKWNGSSWTSVSTLPYSFYRGDAVVYNNEIHILGSSYSSSSYTKHYKWNGSSWTSVSTLPYSFYDGAAVVYNNEIHILGSSYSSSSYTKHYSIYYCSFTTGTQLLSYISSQITNSNGNFYAETT